MHGVGVMEQQRKPGGEKGEKEQVVPGSCPAFAAFSCVQAALHLGGCLGEECGAGATPKQCVQALLQHVLRDLSLVLGWAARSVLGDSALPRQFSHHRG